MTELAGRRALVTGAAGGIVLALVASEVMGRYLSGVEAGSLLPYLAAFVAMGCTAVASAALPAARAVRVDPVHALRSE